MQSQMENRRNILGLMSGTSLDGVDLVLVSFRWQKNALESTISYEILQSKTYAYNFKWKERLSKANLLNGLDLKLLDHDLGMHFAHLIKDFSQGLDIPIDAISSHGHTVFHNPAAGMTCQIGNGPEIALETGILTICDFRVQDVLLGGQGAPLVPIGDDLLFAEYGACLNLGGFANVSYSHEGRRIAFDISPVNYLLNHYCRKSNLEYDAGGALARKGEVCAPLLKELDAYDFYHQEKHHPKSLGQEQILDFYLPLIDSYNLSLNAVLATIVEHAVNQINRVLAPMGKTVLITGGGAYNDYLIELLQKENLKITLPSPELIEFKEALIFALLGLLKQEDKINIYASVTGAKKDHSSGVIHYPVS